MRERVRERERARKRCGSLTKGQGGGEVDGGVRNRGTKG